MRSEPTKFSPFQRGTQTSDPTQPHTLKDFCTLTTYSAFHVTSLLSSNLHPSLPQPLQLHPPLSPSHPHFPHPRTKGTFDILCPVQFIP